MEKKCSKCQTVLDISNFNIKGKNADGSIKYQTYCKKCNKERSKQYYAENREKHKKETRKRTNIRIKQVQDNLISYFLSHPCIDCGEADIRVLEFDHLKNKEANISEVIRDWSWKRILNEIDKCEIVCSNCHIIRARTRNNDFRYKAWKLYQLS
jgi:hypothetical protein